MKQNGLPFVVNEKMSLVHFLGEENQPLLNLVNELSQTESEGVVYVYSEQPHGKSHFLQGCAFVASDKNLSAFYVDMQQEVPVEIMDTLLDYDWICLDNINAMNDEQAQALFDFYNNIKGTTKKLFLSSHCPPNALNALQDLKTRLSLAFVFELPVLNDACKIQVIQQKIKEKCMHIDKNVYLYLFKHYSRDLNQVLDAIALLDKASVEKKSKISIALVNAVLSV
jgi:DnaA family protein